MSTTIDIRVVNNSSNELPDYAHESDAGFDLRANVEAVKNTKFLFNASLDTEEPSVTIFPGGRALIPTGLHMAIPEGYELQVRPRSGLALKSGITVLNTPGTIDAGYRGDIGVILMNNGSAPFKVLQGDRIAQGVLNQILIGNFIISDTLDDSDRGNTGFGDSGVK